MVIHITKEEVRPPPPPLPFPSLTQCIPERRLLGTVAGPERVPALLMLSTWLILFWRLICAQEEAIAPESADSGDPMGEGMGGAVGPDGEIDWDCPCLAGTATSTSALTVSHAHFTAPQPPHSRLPMRSAVCPYSLHSLHADRRLQSDAVMTCPIASGMTNGPCGDSFKEAFSCFV